MRLVLKFAILATLLVTISACGLPAHPGTASDFCLSVQRINAEPAPSAGANDPGNHFDTDDTFFQVLEHNQVIDRLCPKLRAAPPPTKEN